MGRKQLNRAMGHQKRVIIIQEIQKNGIGQGKVYSGVGGLA